MTHTDAGALLKLAEIKAILNANLKIGGHDAWEGHYYSVIDIDAAAEAIVTRQAASQGSAGGEAVATAKIDLALKIVGEPASGHKMMSSRREAFSVHGLLKEAKAALSRPAPTGGAETQTDEELAKEIHRVAGCQVGSERCKNIIRWFREKQAARPVDAGALHAAQAVPGCGEDAIREAAESTAVGAQIVRRDGDLLIYYSGFNLSRFVRYLALAASSVPSADREGK